MCRNPALILLALGLVGAMAACAAPSGNPGAPPAMTNQPVKSQPEDLDWSAAHKALKELKYREAAVLFKEYTGKHRNDRRHREALFYQGLCELIPDLGQRPLR